MATSAKEYMQGSYLTVMLSNVDLGELASMNDSVAG